jgi:RNA polymerase sigma-70 factor (ECF subfamily)
VPTRFTSEKVTTLSPIGVEALVSERERFRRFLIRRVGNANDAEDILQESLLKALQQGDRLKRNEKIIPWFYRILRNATVDHFRRNGSEARKATNLYNEMNSTGPADARVDHWERAVCRCFEGLLPSLKPRQAELIRRIDLLNEPKHAVATHLKISAATLNVAHHRARQSLRRRLEIFCGACSREQCLACACGQT